MYDIGPLNERRQNSEQRRRNRMAKPLMAISHVQTIDLYFPIICHAEDTAKTVSVGSQDPHVASKLC